MLLLFAAAFAFVQSTVGPSDANAARINTTSQTALTTTTKDGIVVMAMSPGASSVDVIDTQTGTVTSTVALGVPTNVAKDIDWNESMQKALISTSDGRVLTLDPATSTVATLATKTGSSFDVVGADPVHSGTAGWVVDSTTNTLYEVTMVGLTVNAGNTSAGQPVAVDTMAGHNLAGTGDYVMVLMDNTNLGLQNGTIADVFNGVMYLYVGGWGAAGQPIEQEPVNGRLEVVANQSLGGGGPWTGYTLNLTVPPPWQGQTWVNSAAGEAHGFANPDGDMAVVLVHQSGTGASVYSFYDFGDPANVKHAGDLVVDVGVTPVGGLSAAMEDEGGSLDDMVVTHVVPGSQVSHTQVHEVTDDIVYTDPGTIGATGTGSSTTPSLPQTPDSELLHCVDDCEERSEISGPTATPYSVQFATGEEVHRLPVFSVPGVGLDLTFRMTYRSRADYDYRYGRGWFLNHDRRIYTETNGDITFHTGTGRRDTFQSAGGGVFYAPLEYDSTLTQAGGITTITDRFGRAKTFNASGYCTQDADRYGNTIAYTWTGDQLTGITDTLGRAYTLTYDANGRLTSVSDFGGRTWTFRYDYLGQMVRMTTPSTTAFANGRSYRYSYSGNSAVTAFRHNMLHAWSPRGARAVSWQYDDNDMVAKETSGPESWLITYHATLNQTTVVDRSGNTEVLDFDTRGALIKRDQKTKGLRVGEPAGFVTHYTWDSQTGLIKTVVHPRGNRTDYTYDSSLNLIELRHKETNTSSNSSSDIVSGATYGGAYNQRTQAVDPRGNVTAFTVDSSGNTTQVTRATVTSPATQNISETFTFDSRGRIQTATDGAGRKTEFSYYSSGHQAGYLHKVRRDPAGLDLTTTFAYDQYGNVISVTDPRGNTATITVDAENYVLEATAPNPLNYKTRFTHDADRNVTKVEVENIDRKGVVDPTTPWIATTISYNDVGWVLSKTVDLTSLDTATTTFEYEGSGLVTKITSAEGNAVSFEYDERNLLFKTTRGDGTSEASTSRCDYDANGNLTSVTDGRGNATTYEYDLFDRRSKATDALGHYAEYAYDASSNLTSVTARDVSQAMVARSTFHLDEVDRVWKIVRDRVAAGIPTTYPTTVVTRDAGHLVTEVKDPLGNATSMTYDTAGRRKTTTDAVGNLVDTTYDAAGNVTKVQTTEIPATGPAEVFTTEYVYDVLNRLTTIKEIDRLNARNVLTTTLEYDSRSNMTFRTDAEGNPVRWTYDLASRMTKYERALVVGTQIDDFTTAIEESFAYDKEHRLYEITDDNFNNTTYVYDALSRRTRTTYADTRQVNWTYDKNDNVATRSDQAGTVVTNTFDVLDRLIARTVSKGTGVLGTSAETYTYDALGRLLTAIDDDYQVEMTWDSVGNLLSEKQGYSTVGQEKWKTVGTSFNDAGALMGIVYPSAFSAVHTRDAIYRLTAIQDAGASANVSTHTWQGVGRPASTTNQNGTVTDFAYDGFRRIASIDHLTPSQSFHKFEYAYNKAHVRRMEKNSFSTTWIATLPTAVQTFLNGRNGKGDVYAYDKAYRLTDARYDVTNPLTEVSSPGSQAYVKLVQYTLDGLGNRSQTVTTPGGGSPTTVTYASDVVNQYTTIGGINRTHDLNGNLKDDGTNKYAYDFANRLVEVRDSSTSTLKATYAYDPLGRRVEKVISGGATTRYVLCRQQVVEEYDGADLWQARYIYEDGIDNPRAMDRADIADVDGDSNTGEVLRFHYHQNAQGSVSELTQPTGAVVEWITYDVYGSRTIRDVNGSAVGQSAVGNPYQYIGREYDAEAGLYHFRARAYDALAGRFLQRDPMGYVDGLGLYAYVSSSPATFVDPYGHEGEKKGRSAVGAGVRALGEFIGLGGVAKQVADKLSDKAIKALLAEAAAAINKVLEGLGTVLDDVERVLGEAIEGGVAGACGMAHIKAMHPDLWDRLKWPLKKLGQAMEALEAKLADALQQLLPFLTDKAAATLTRLLGYGAGLGLARVVTRLGTALKKKSPGKPDAEPKKPTSTDDNKPNTAPPLGNRPPEVGPGASLDNLTEAEIRGLQKAADETGVEVTAVGSRVDGTAGSASDIDVLVPPGSNSKVKKKVKRHVPAPREGGVSGAKKIDIHAMDVDESRPFIRFFPKK